MPDEAKEDLKTKEGKIKIENNIVQEVCVNRMLNDENVIWAIDYFVTPENEYCILLEKMDKTLQDRIDEEIEKGTYFPEWKIWVYF